METTTATAQHPESHTIEPRSDVSLWAGGMAAVVVVAAVVVWLVFGRSNGGSTAGADRIGDVQLVVAGVPRPIEGPLPLSGDLTATIAMTTGETPFSRTIDLALAHTSDASEATTPVADATVRATAHMQLMDHGTIAVEAIAERDGRFRLPLAFSMAGDWAIEIEVVTPDSTSRVELAVGVWD